MDRRLFVGGGIAGLTLHALGASAQPAKPQSGPGYRFPWPPIRQLCLPRRDIRALGATELAAFRAGVAAMMARPANDPTSWSYQAAIHGTFAAGTLPLWRTCEHGSLAFFSWHRLFLYYFERILRAASGSSTLTLPYWDWTSQRALPAPFLDGTPGNPLFLAFPARGAAMSLGGLLPLSAVDMGVPNAETAFFDFSGQIEGSPHGAVHSIIGGLMGQVPSAGQDPIFWLHHCNIDRMWERWLALGGGRVNTTNAAWLNQSFGFFDHTGAQVTHKAMDGLNICAQLRYRYEDYQRFVDVNPTYIPIRLLPYIVWPPRDRPEIVYPRPILLTGLPVRVSLPIAKLADAVGGRRLLLAFEGLRVRDPEGYFEIYLNPRGTKELTLADPSYAGNLVLFGVPVDGRKNDHAMMHEGSDRRVFDVSGKLADLRKRGMFDPERLDVVLVLRRAEGGDGRNAPGDRAVASIERVRLVAD